MVSVAVSPTGPTPFATQASAAAPCSHTAVSSACWGTAPCANSVAMMPVSTSPIPALAMPGLPLALMRHGWPGDAQMLPAPLSTTWAS